jgi:hypothetical protein
MTSGAMRPGFIKGQRNMKPSRRDRLAACIINQLLQVTCWHLGGEGPNFWHCLAVKRLADSNTYGRVPLCWAYRKISCLKFWNRIAARITAVAALVFQAQARSCGAVSINYTITHRKKDARCNPQSTRLADRSYSILSSGRCVINWHVSKTVLFFGVPWSAHASVASQVSGIQHLSPRREHTTIDGLHIL